MRSKKNLKLAIKILNQMIELDSKGVKSSDDIFTGFFRNPTMKDLAEWAKHEIDLWSLANWSETKGEK